MQSISFVPKRVEKNVMWLWQLYYTVDVYVLGKATSYVCLFAAVFWTGSNRIPVAGVESMKVTVLTPHVMCTNSAVAYAKWCCNSAVAYAVDYAMHAGTCIEHCLP